MIPDQFKRDVKGLNDRYQYFLDTCKDISSDRSNTTTLSAIAMSKVIDSSNYIYNKYLNK